MKRTCAFFAVICLMLSAVAVRLYFARLDNFVGGKYTAFDKNDEEISVSISKGYERADISGDTVKSVIETLKARIIKTENVGDITVIYAYSPMILKSVKLHGVTINLMIAKTSDRTVVGSPLIKGSY